MKKMKNDNKGFTLVELIVVLVILAILAAILVPALLGYIDEARNKQLQLHGKGVYTAAQSKASQAYGKFLKIQDTKVPTGATTCPAQDFGIAVADLAELDSFNTNNTVIAYISFESNAEADGKKYYTVKDIIYTEDGGNTGVVMLGKAGDGKEAWEYIDKKETLDGLLGSGNFKKYLIVTSANGGDATADASKL